MMEREKSGANHGPFLITVMMEREKRSGANHGTFFNNGNDRKKVMIEKEAARIMVPFLTITI